MILTAVLVGVGILLFPRLTADTDVPTAAGEAQPAAQTADAPLTPETVVVTELPDDTSSADRSAAAPVTPTSTPTPTESADEAAEEQLYDYRADAAEGLVFNGRWVAQLASKAPGITDDLAVTSSGSHVFYAPDILAEFERLRSMVPGTVLLLQSTDYGPRQTWNGQPMWVTFADNGFGSKTDVEAWCRSQFPGLDGSALINACVPRQLNPPR